MVVTTVIAVSPDKRLGTPLIRRWPPHQGLAGPNPRRFRNIVAEFETSRRKHNDSRTVLEPAEFIPLPDVDVTRKYRRPPSLRIEHQVEEMQADTGNQDCGHRHQRKRLSGRQAGPDHRALVLAE